jgi:PadR family transcriptional regulator, regulatory protein PadR
MSDITKLEEIFLLAIWRLQDNAYGVKIKKMIKQIADKEISYGALYFTLDQISKKNLVAKTIGEPTPVRGGGRKIFYRLTADGTEALKQAHKLHSAIWEGISFRLLDKNE